MSSIGLTVRYIFILALIALSCALTCTFFKFIHYSINYIYEKCKNRNTILPVNQNRQNNLQTNIIKINEIPIVTIKCVYILNPGDDLDKPKHIGIKCEKKIST